jgi:hypothetical protein
MKPRQPVRDVNKLGKTDSSFPEEGANSDRRRFWKMRGQILRILDALSRSEGAFYFY